MKPRKLEGLSIAKLTISMSFELVLENSHDCLVNIFNRLSFN
jgi:hypothetical protein